MMPSIKNTRWCFLQSKNVYISMINNDGETKLGKVGQFDLPVEKWDTDGKWTLGVILRGGTFSILKVVEREEKST